MPSSTTQRKDISSPKQNSKHHYRDPIYIGSSLVAGVGSGALASIVCAPLDLVRTRMQVWGDLEQPSTSSSSQQQQQRHSNNFLRVLHDIWKQDGWKGCFRGLGATLVTVPLFWGIYFPLYEEFKIRWATTSTDAQNNATTHPSLIHCGSAISAGVISDFICNPMFVVRTRLQTEALHLQSSFSRRSPQTSMVATAKSLYQEGGVRIFWRGMTANLMGLSHVGVQFPIYEWLKKHLTLQKKFEKDTPTILELFLASGLSKMSASLLTYPHEVIRSRMMDSRCTTQTPRFIGTIRRIYVTEGWMGFYAGLPVTLFRVVPNCCITFMTYELFLQWAKKNLW